MKRSQLLLVEDDADLRGLLEEMLVDAGFAVEATGSASAALASLLKSMPDALITDERLHSMSGLDIAREARARGAKLPVILLTGATTADVAALQQRHDVDEVLLKPRDCHRLVEAVRELLGRK